MQRLGTVQKASRAIASWTVAAYGAVALLAAPLVWGTPYRSPARLQHWTLDERGGEASLTLTLSTPVRLHLQRLHRPERLVIDLPHTLAHESPALPARTSVISAVRSGTSKGGNLRLVLELGSARLLSVRPLERAHGREWQVLLSAAPIVGSSPPATIATPASPASHVSAARTNSGAAAANAAAPIATPIAARRVPRGEHEVIVVVDPGHGGLDPGATGRDGAHEKDLTLQIARELAARIDREPGMRAVLTRDGDYFITLSGRLEQARRAHADFFVSIHADSVRDPRISGASVYVLSERGASSEAARRLADAENAADLRGGVPLAAQAPELRSVLLDLSQSASIGESAEAANHVLGALAGVGAVRKREVQRAAFVVLKAPYIPSMLVETAYISNGADERRLESPVEQQRLAEAIFQGIANYFHQYPPPGSLFARTRDPRVPASS